MWAILLGAYKTPWKRKNHAKSLETAFCCTLGPRRFNLDLSCGKKWDYNIHDTMFIIMTINVIHDRWKPTCISRLILYLLDVMWVFVIKIISTFWIDYMVWCSQCFMSKMVIRNNINLILCLGINWWSMYQFSTAMPLS